MQRSANRDCTARCPNGSPAAAPSTASSLVPQAVAQVAATSAPGSTGPFGAAVAAGCLLQLDELQMTHALGIAASLASGLLEVAKSGTGAMVKRLHLGRAAEAGVLGA